MGTPEGRPLGRCGLGDPGECLSSFVSYLLFWPRPSTNPAGTRQGRIRCHLKGRCSDCTNSHPAAGRKGNHYLHQGAQKAGPGTPKGVTLGKGELGGPGNGKRYLYQGSKVRPNQSPNQPRSRPVQSLYRATFGMIPAGHNRATTGPLKLFSMGSNPCGVRVSARSQQKT